MSVTKCETPEHIILLTFGLHYNEEQACKDTAFTHSGGAFDTHFVTADNSNSGRIKG